MSPAAVIIFGIFIVCFFWIVALEMGNNQASEPLYLFMDKEVKRLAKTLHKLIEENEGELIRKYGMTKRIYTICIYFSRPLTEKEKWYLHFEVNFEFDDPCEEKPPVYEIGVGDYQVIGHIEVYDQ